MRTGWLLVWALGLAASTVRAEEAAESMAPDPEVDLHDDDAPANESAGRTTCTVEPVTLRRTGFPGPLLLSLTTCDGEPSSAALLALSELARPASESADSIESDGMASAVRPLNKGLLERLQQIADHYSGHAIELVSGYRPNARVGSRHRSADALDLRVDGVDSAELSAFVRTFAATGVGYYPNSGFVHMDVRKESYAWVDTSGPGQAPRYQPANEQLASAVDKAVTTASETAAPKPGAASELAAKVAREEPPSAEPAPTQAQLDAELQGLAERALVVMNVALGRAPSTSSALPNKDEPSP